MRLSLPLSASLGLLALTAGCAGAGQPGLETVHQPVVSQADYALDLALSGNRLAGDEAQRFEGWARNLQLGYGDRVTIEDPAGDALAPIARSPRWSAVTGCSSGRRHRSHARRSPPPRSGSSSPALAPRFRAARTGAATSRPTGSATPRPTMAARSTATWPPWSPIPPIWFTARKARPAPILPPRPAPSIFFGRPSRPAMAAPYCGVPMPGPGAAAA